MSNRSLFTLAFVIALLILPCTCPGQSALSENLTGSGKGYVIKAADGQPILRARVEFVIPTTGWTVTALTGRDGDFSFTALPPAVYQVNVSAPAYETLHVSVKVEETSRPLLLRLRRCLANATPVNDSVVSIQELRMDGGAESAFRKGTRLLQKGDAQGSVPYFQAAVAKDPTYYRAYHNLGLAYYRMGQLTDAENDFQKSIDLTDGGYAPSEFALAMILCRKRDWQRAQQLVENGLAMDPGSALGKYLLGLVQFGLDRLADAERSSQDALKRDANQADAHILLAQIHERMHNPYAVMSDIAAYFAAEPSGPLQMEAKNLLRQAQCEVQQRASVNK